MRNSVLTFWRFALLAVLVHHTAMAGRYLAIQNVHTPYTLPAPWETKNYSNMWDNTYANMLAVMDTVVANVTNALHDSGLWDDTLVLFTADNGM